MPKIAFTLMLSLFSTLVFAQQLNVKSVKPDSSGFENIYVKKVAEDAKQSTFIIWIKQGVKAHYHATHTEFVTVISGRGIMQLGDKTFKVKKGDCVVIPLGEAHSALTTSKKPLKVISVQAPRFDGDRVWVK